MNAPAEKLPVEPLTPEELAQVRALLRILRQAAAPVDAPAKTEEEPSEPTAADYERVKRLKSKKGIRHGA